MKRFSESVLPCFLYGITYEPANVDTWIADFKEIKYY